MARSIRDRSTGAKLVLFRVLLLTFSVGISLLFAELLLRIVAPQPPSWLAIYQPHPALPFYSMLPGARLHVDTGETNWTIATDDNGFRFNPDLQKKPHCTTLWLGDSYAFGHGLDYPETFVGNLDSRLPDVRVLNASVSGYGPTQYRQTLEYLIEQGLQFDDLIVASYVGNDFHDTKWEKSRVVADGIIGNRNDVKSLLMKNLHLYRLVASLYHRFTPNTQPSYLEVVNQLARPQAWNEEFLSEARSLYETEMSRILELGRNEGAEVTFLILPTRQAVSYLAGESQTIDAGSTHQPMLPVEKAAEIFERLGAPYLDLTPVIAKNPTEEMFFQFDGHLTRIGSSEVANAVFEAFSLHCDPTVSPAN